MPKLCPLFSFKPVLAFWHGSRFAAFLIHQILILLCGHPAAKRPEKAWSISVALDVWTPSLEAGSYQVKGIFSRVVRKYYWSLPATLPASWKNLRRNADAYYFREGTIALAIVGFECAVSCDASTSAFHRPPAGYSSCNKLPCLGLKIPVAILWIHVNQYKHFWGVAQAAAWKITEYIKCYVQIIFTVGMSEYQKACALESRYYSLLTTTFSRFLKNVCLAVEKTTALLSPCLVLLFLDSRIWNVIPAGLIPGSYLTCLAGKPVLVTLPTVKLCRDKTLSRNW